MADIKITLETLYDILRNEKKREDLQKLEATFFLDVITYLREKQALLEQKQRSSELFAAGERDKLDYELRSIRRILKEIYDKREKKIMDIAVNRARTGSDIIDTSSMLREEKEFYQRLLETLSKFRQGILGKVMNGLYPEIEEKEQQAIPNAPPQNYGSATASSLGPSTKTASALLRIKVTHPLPSFVWKDMKTYGPYDEGEEVEIFSEVAELIVRKGRAVKV